MAEHAANDDDDVARRCLSDAATTPSPSSSCRICRSSVSKSAAASSAAAAAAELEVEADALPVRRRCCALLDGLGVLTVLEGTEVDAAAVDAAVARRCFMAEGGRITWVRAKAKVRVGLGLGSGRVRVREGRVGVRTAGESPG